MNKPFIAKASMLSFACCALLSACSDSDFYYGSVSAGSSNYGYSEYSNGIYDSNGFPIFGYMGGRPVYGYNSYGSPIFSFTYIRSNCYVPHWRPAPYYSGRYHYPHGIHRVYDLPHHQHGWKEPRFDNGRPSIGHRPGFNLGNRPGNNHFVNNPGMNNRPSINPGRPSQRPEFNRPGNRPSGNINRPQWNGNSSGERPSFNRPSWGSGNRPNSNSGIERPSRPQWNGNNSGERPSFNRPSREPGSNPGINRPSVSPGGGGFSRPEGGPRPSRPGRPNHGGSAPAAPVAPANPIV